MSEPYGRGRWVPNPVPTDPEDIPSYLNSEFQRLSDLINNTPLSIPVVYKQPEKPRTGDLMYVVDDTIYDPGSGAGIYYYNNSGVWTLL